MNAQQTIEHLRSSFINDRFQFDFQVSMVLSGDRNKKLRQEIMALVTGEQKPISKCGMHAVSDALMARFQQPELFA